MFETECLELIVEDLDQLRNSGARLLWRVILCRTAQGLVMVLVRIEEVVRSVKYPVGSEKERPPVCFPVDGDAVQSA